MLAQHFLYNQLSPRYLAPGVTHACYIVTTTPVVWPRGKILDFHPISQVLAYAAGLEFCQELSKLGIQTEFIVAPTYQLGLEEFVKRSGVNEITMMDSSEAYIRQKFIRIQGRLQAKWICLTSFRNREFICEIEEFRARYPKPPLMEYFYRFMRVKTGLLMIDGKPEGDTWNYDHENRGFDRVHTPIIRKALPESSHLIEAREFYGYSGAFLFPTSRAQALVVFDDFITHHLADFGRLEDASYQEDDLVHHSLISTALNMGLLSPLEVATRVAESDAPLAAREGFVRQIIGWREFVHQFFEFYEGDIHTMNHFNQSAPLPPYFWGSRYQEVGTETLSTRTNLSCVDRVIERVDRLGYSHHIERLMVIGNFSLLTDRDPHSVNQWFWEQYADAYEWVVTPNVIAMSQFADAGRLASKPYIASANYINKMSDSCKNCRYDPKEKYGENACPLNYLYWTFVDSNRDEFIRGRQPFILNQLPKLDLEKLHQQKAHFLARIGDSGTLS